LNPYIPSSHILKNSIIDIRLLHLQSFTNNHFHFISNGQLQCSINLTWLLIGFPKPVSLLLLHSQPYLMCQVSKCIIAMAIWLFWNCAPFSDMRQSHSSITSPFRLSVDVKSLLYYQILTQYHSDLSQETTYFTETFVIF